MGFLAWIFIGLIAGWLATQILGGRGGLFYNLAVAWPAPSSAAFCSRSSTCRSCQIFGAI